MVAAIAAFSDSTPSAAPAGRAAEWNANSRVRGALHFRRQARALVADKKCHGSAPVHLPRCKGSSRFCDVPRRNCREQANTRNTKLGLKHRNSHARKDRQSKRRPGRGSHHFRRKGMRSSSRARTANGQSARAQRVGGAQNRADIARILHADKHDDKRRSRPIQQIIKGSQSLAARVPRCPGAFRWRLCFRTCDPMSPTVAHRIANAGRCLSRCLRPLSLTRIASIGISDRKASSTSRIPSIPAQPPDCSLAPARAARKRCSQRFSRPDIAVGCRDGWAGEKHAARLGE